MIWDDVDGIELEGELLSPKFILKEASLSRIATNFVWVDEILKKIYIYIYIGMNYLVVRINGKLLICAVK